MKKVVPRNQKSGRSGGTNRNGGNNHSGNKGRNDRNTRNAGAGRRDKNDRNEANHLSRKWIIPLIFIVAVVPLISMYHMYDCGLEKYPWYSAQGVVTDLFLYYKSFFLRLAGVAVLLILAYLIPTRDHSFIKDKRNIPPITAIAVFGIVTLGSSILSAHVSDAFWGGYEQFEGCFVLLTYAVCFFMAFGYAKTTKLLRFLMDALMIGAIVIGLLGVLQLLGYNWLDSEWIRSILTLELRSKIDLSRVQMGANSGVSYATLYNRDYVGSYATLVLPYCGYLILRGEKIWRRIVAVFAFGLLTATLFGSEAITGLIALMGGIVVGIILIFPRMKVFIKIGTVVAGVAAIAVISYVLISRGIFRDLFVEEKSERAIDWMKTDENSVLIKTMEGKKIKLTVDPSLLAEPLWPEGRTVSDSLTVADADTGNPINTTLNENNGRLHITQDGYPELVLFFREEDLPEKDRMVEQKTSTFVIKDGDFGWKFASAEPGKLLYFFETTGRYDKLRNVPTMGFTGKEDFANGRGYIWAHTIPKLLDSILLGYGPDNFVYAYPNDDYVDKTYHSGYYKQVTTKPHNMFLQIWVQEGLIALIAFLFLYGLFVVRVFRMCYGRKKLAVNPETERGVTYRNFALVTAIAASAYMITGFANDSVVAVAPIYWIMLGAGYAAEWMARREGILAVDVSQADETIIPAEEAAEEEKKPSSADKDKHGK